MIDSVDARVLISREELLTNARMIEARGREEGAELARLLQVRRFIAASFELTRSLHAQTQCAVVNHCGTIGTSSLEEATETLFGALVEYAAQCRALAIEARKSADASATWERDRLAVAVG